MARERAAIDAELAGQAAGPSAMARQRDRPDPRGRRARSSRRPTPGAGDRDDRDDAWSSTGGSIPAIGRGPSEATARCRADPDAPVGAVSFDEAARFCNWLSRARRAPARGVVLPPRRCTRATMVLAPDYLSRRGYRLPTPARVGVRRPGGDDHRSLLRPVAPTRRRLRLVQPQHRQPRRAGGPQAARTTSASSTSWATWTNGATTPTRPTTTGATARPPIGAECRKVRLVSVRGGSYSQPEGGLTVAGYSPTLDRLDPDETFRYIGFRVVRQRALIRPGRQAARAGRAIDPEADSPFRPSRSPARHVGEVPDFPRDPENSMANATEIPPKTASAKSTSGGCGSCTYTYNQHGRMLPPASPAAARPTAPARRSSAGWARSSSRPCTRVRRSPTAGVSLPCTSAGSDEEATRQLAPRR